MLGGGVADVGERPRPGDHREHGDGQRVRDREQAPARVHEASGRPGRPGRPGGPSPPGSDLAPLPPYRGGGAAAVNAESFTPGCLLNARAGGHRAAGDEGERLARPGQAELPSSTEIGFQGPFHFLPWNQVPEGQGSRLLREVRCTWRGPLLYLVWTRDVPGAPPVLACPADARRWSANRFHVHARHGPGRPGAAASCARTRFRPCITVAVFRSVTVLQLSVVHGSGVAVTWCHLLPVAAA